MYHGFGHGYGFGGPNILCVIIGLIVFIDLVLLGVWIWQKIRREERENCSHHNGHHCGHHDGHHKHEVKGEDKN